ncbi:MAG: DUF6702 family protein [Gillisia sp.]
MKYRILFLLLIFSLSSFKKSHKFYVSVTEIEYNEEVQSLQIISRIFTDDLEALLQERYDPTIKLLSSGDEGAVKANLKKYLGQKFRVQVNGKPYEVNYLGKEYEDDMTLLYLEVPNVSSVKSVKIKNAILTDLFPEQKNLVHVELKGTTKSLILTGERDEDKLIFNE